MPFLSCLILPKPIPYPFRTPFAPFSHPFCTPLLPFSYLYFVLFLIFLPFLLTFYHYLSF